jgi:hypothetical protein
MLEMRNAGHLTLADGTTREAGYGCGVGTGVRGGYWVRGARAGIGGDSEDWRPTPVDGSAGVPDERWEGERNARLGDDTTEVVVVPTTDETQQRRRRRHRHRTPAEMNGNGAPAAILPRRAFDGEVRLDAYIDGDGRYKTKDKKLLCVCRCVFVFVVCL